MTAWTERVDRAKAWLRDPNPIRVKELRATFRTPLYIRFLYLSVLVVAFLVLGGAALAASGSQPPAEVGRILFQSYFVLAYLLLALIAPGYASAAITSEREGETWESLQMSGIAPWRIVAGKLSAAYASIALVLVALSPVVGIAFLFGGVGPAQVLIGFASLLVFLVPAVAYGVALSAHLKSTRASIGVATITFFPVALLHLGYLSVLGDDLDHTWGLAMGGPFFYTEALGTRLHEASTWALLVVAPLVSIALTTWFFVAAAIGGVRPATEDRSGPLKVWGVATAVAVTGAGPLGVLAMDGARDRAKLSVVLAVGVAALSIGLAHVYCGDGPTPSRASVRAARRGPTWRRILALVGPGAAGNLRFGALLLAAVVGGFLVTTLGARHLLDPSFDQALRYDASVLSIALGALLVAGFAHAVANGLRLLLSNRLAARVLTFGILLAGALVPFFLALLLDANGVDRLGRQTPLLVHLSAVYPLVLAVQIGDGNAPAADLYRLGATAASYGILALALGAFVELKCVAARRAQRRRMDAHTAEVPDAEGAVEPVAARPTDAPAEDE